METFVPSTIRELEILDPGELCRVTLVLPNQVEVGGTSFRIQDDMRPGTAFLGKPWGSRTQKHRRRMYTRSNVSTIQPGVLETFINYTHKPQSDTSMWWQSDEARIWQQTKTPIAIKVVLNVDQQVATVYENAGVCKPSNLRLEEDGVWESLALTCVAFGTGITPFLAYLRYWVEHRRHHSGGGKNNHPLTLIVSARHYSQLICHDELIDISKEFAGEFFYYPNLTRTWPEQWSGLTGRIMTLSRDSTGNEQIDLSRLLKLSPSLAHQHLRLCGNGPACRQIVTGLEQAGVTPLSVRSESW